jgi:hypothetical protein
MPEQLDFWVGLIAGLWVAVLVLLLVRLEFKPRPRRLPPGCLSVEKAKTVRQVQEEHPSDPKAWGDFDD